MALWWFVTWSTYGTWLPGDPRGFQTWRGRSYVAPPKRFAKPGEATYNPEDYRDLYEHMKTICPQGVYLTPVEQQLALDAFVQKINSMPLLPRIIAVTNWHTHLLAQFRALKIRPTVGQLKFAATMNIPNPGTRPRIWANNCHMKSVADEQHYYNLIRYAQRHIDQGALIHEWPERGYDPR